MVTGLQFNMGSPQCRKFKSPVLGSLQFSAMGHWLLGVFQIAVVTVQWFA